MSNRPVFTEGWSSLRPNKNYYSCNSSAAFGGGCLNSQSPISSASVAPANNYGAAAGVRPVVNPPLATAAAAAAAQDGLSQLPALRDRVRRHVAGVIRCLPIAQSQAYLEAVQRDAELVITETDPLQFVRFCNYDIWEGAQRLCLYWTERKRHFGPDRAFLPLVLTGTGALTQEDLLTLRSGFPALLPDMTTGHKCFFVDRRKRVSGVRSEHILRCLFYLHKLLAENDLSQVEVAHCFMVVITPRTKSRDEMDWNLIRVGAHLSTRIFPVRLKIHLLSFPRQKGSFFAMEFIMAAANVYRQYYGDWLQIHFETQTNQVLNELLALGLTKSGIPLSVGGDWRYEHFSEWCQERMIQEREQYQDRLLTQDAPSWQRFTNTSIPAPSTEPTTTETTTHTEDGGGSSSSDNNKKMSPQAQKAAKQRVKDILRSRQKRERRRVEFQSLREESTELEADNQRLLTEQARLQRLLAEAEECVAQLSRYGLV